MKMEVSAQLLNDLKKDFLLNRTSMIYSNSTSKNQRLAISYFGNLNSVNSASFSSYTKEAQVSKPNQFISKIQQKKNEIILKKNIRTQNKSAVESLIKCQSKKDIADEHFSNDFISFKNKVHKLNIVTASKNLNI